MSERTATFVRGLMDRKAPAAANCVTRQGRPAFSAADRYAHPYEIRFAADDDGGGSGRWLIWLPSPSVLVVNGQPVDVVSGLDEAGDGYPVGWYVLGFLSEGGGDVYLNVRVGPHDAGSGRAEVAASFSDAPDEDDSEGDVVYPLLIASCAAGMSRATVDSAVVIGDENGVTSLNDQVGDIDVIGGQKIRVTTDGKTIKVSLDEDKSEDDPDPNNRPDPCEHPENGSGGSGSGNGAGGDDTPGRGGGSVRADEGETGDTGGGGGCSGCGGSSTTGGSGGGSPQPGAQGKPAEGASGGGASAPGKEVTAPPTGQGPSGTATSDVGGKPAPGLLGASGAKTPIYAGTHSTLTDSKKMSRSPFGPIGGAATPIADTRSVYGGAHSQLTNARKLNESPFRRNQGAT